jgi:hypothetical protein
MTALQGETEVVTRPDIRTVSFALRDGTRLRLRFGFNQVIELEESLGLQSLESEISSKDLGALLKPRKNVRILVRILLRTHHPDLVESDEAAGLLIDNLNLDEFLDAMMQAYWGYTDQTWTEIKARAKEKTEGGTPSDPPPDAEAGAPANS